MFAVVLANPLHTKVAAGIDHRDSDELQNWRPIAPEDETILRFGFKGGETQHDWDTIRPESHQPYHARNRLFGPLREYARGAYLRLD